MVYYKKLDPFSSGVLDDPHGHCRAFCDSEVDCLGYVYHIAGRWHYVCALYTTMAIGDDSALYSVINEGWTTVPNGDMEINEISKVQPFEIPGNEEGNGNNMKHEETQKVLGFCFVKTQAPKPIVEETCIEITGFDPIITNPPAIHSASIVTCHVSLVCCGAMLEVTLLVNDLVW